MKFDYYMPVHIVSGSGCVRTFDKYAQLGAKCMIVAGRHLYKTSRAFLDVYDGLKRNGVTYTLFTEVENNPSYETVLRIVEQIKKEQAAFVIGIGGGSCMDAAKVAALLATNPDVRGADIYQADNFKNRPLPLILIGTTAGTGSEVTAVGVLTTDLDGQIVKRSVKSPYSYADYALCDAAYTYTLPQAYTLSTALDSISHAIEAYGSKKSGLFEKEYACSALRLVTPALQDYAQHGATAENRQALYTGSILAGLAINGGGTNVAHSMGYQLTNYLGYAHGFACAAILPVVVNMGGAEVLDMMGMENAAEFELFVYDLIRQGMSPVHITREQAQQFARLAMQMPSLNNHVFKPVTYEDCVEIYMETAQKLFGGCTHG